MVVVLVPEKKWLHVYEDITPELRKRFIKAGMIVVDTKLRYVLDPIVDKYMKDLGT